MNTEIEFHNDDALTTPCDSVSWHYRRCGRGKLAFCSVWLVLSTFVPLAILTFAENCVLNSFSKGKFCTSATHHHTITIIIIIIIIIETRQREERKLLEGDPSTISANANSEAETTKKQTHRLTDRRTDGRTDRLGVDNRWCLETRRGNDRRFTSHARQSAKVTTQTLRELNNFQEGLFFTQ